MTSAGAMPSRKGAQTAIGIALGAVAVAVVLILASSPSSSGPGPSPPSYPTQPASLGGINGSLVSLTGGFLGINVRADDSFTSADASALNATGVRLVRWPGGGNGDRYDPLGDNGQGVIYNGAGQPSVASTSLESFVSWCRSVSCGSVITLPAEIDNASLALTIVNYTETTLGFHPTYWEIGNEPALWDHFGIPWTSWNDSQNSTPTPMEYAGEVQSYVRAIRTVDPTTRIIGLGGIGKGSSEVSEWFAPTIALNGPNLSGMAIHVYPASSGFPSGDLSSWFGSLWGNTGIPGRVLSAEAVMKASCATCRLSLLVDEFQSGTGLSASTSLTGGYLATYIAAELVQALPLPLASLDFYDFRSVTPGAWFNTTGASSPSYALYRGLDEFFGSYAAQLNVSSGGPGLLAAVGGTASGSLTSVLLVNTNATDGFRVNLSAWSSLVTAGSSAWAFNGSSSQPTSSPLGTGSLEEWTVPPASLVVLSGVGPFGINSSGLAESRFPSMAAARLPNAQGTTPVAGLSPAAIPRRFAGASSLGERRVRDRSGTCLVADGRTRDPASRFIRTPFASVRNSLSDLRKLYKP